MATTVKKQAVSLPKELADRVAEIAQSQHLSYSGLIKEALVRYIEELKNKELGEAYARYYGDAGNAKKDQVVTKAFLKKSKKTWTA